MHERGLTGFVRIRKLTLDRYDIMAVISAKFVIGVPVFNEEAHIERTLSSIIATVGDEVPVVVSDNGSTDRTREIVSEFSARHPSVHIVVNADGRLASNFLNCLSNSESEYFCWISGHDMICGSFWSEALSLLDSNPSLVWVYGSCNVVDVDGLPMATKAAPDSDIDTVGLRDPEAMAKLLDIRSGMFIHGIFRRSVFVECPFAGGWAGDRCVIAYACFRGEVRWLKKVAVVRRVQRSGGGGETLEERDRRYREWGLLEYEDAGLEPKYYMRLKLFKIYYGERRGFSRPRDFLRVYRILFGSFFNGSWIRVARDLRKVTEVESGFPRIGGMPAKKAG